MDTSLSKVREMVMDRETWSATVHGKELDTTDNWTDSYILPNFSISWNDSHWNKFFYHTFYNEDLIHPLDFYECLLQPIFQRK